MNTAEGKFVVDELRPQLARASAGKAGIGARRVFWMALLLALPCGVILAQSPSEQTGTGQQSNHPLRIENGDFEPGSMSSDNDPVFQERRMRQLKAAKYKSIASNTEKLLKLVTQLNAEIGSTNPASLTPEQLRTVAAIEKLARSVKDDMRTPVVAPPAFIEPAQPLDNNLDRR